MSCTRKEFLAQVSVSTLLATSTPIPRPVQADRRASLLRDLPHINSEDGFLSRRAT
jgi:hypothetical protein